MILCGERGLRTSQLGTGPTPAYTVELVNTTPGGRLPSTTPPVRTTPPPAEVWWYAPSTGGLGPRGLTTSRHPPTALNPPTLNPQSKWLPSYSNGIRLSWLLRGRASAAPNPRPPLPRECPHSARHSGGRFGHTRKQGRALGPKQNTIKTPTKTQHGYFCSVYGRGIRVGHLWYVCTQQDTINRWWGEGRKKNKNGEQKSSSVRVLGDLDWCGGLGYGLMIEYPNAHTPRPTTPPPLQVKQLLIAAGQIEAITADNLSKTG